jgi:hypothetical protein
MAGYKWPGFLVTGGTGIRRYGPKAISQRLIAWTKPAAGTIRRFYQTKERALGRFFSTLPESLCCCTARIAVEPAQVYFGDRWVAVGDAAISRLYKDGVYSAFHTAGTAMRAAVERGVARQDFERAYAPFCRRLARDNTYGKFLFDLAQYAKLAARTRLRQCYVSNGGTSAAGRFQVDHGEW